MYKRSLIIISCLLFTGSNHEIPSFEYKKQIFWREVNRTPISLKPTKRDNTVKRIFLRNIQHYVSGALPTRIDENPQL